MGFNPLDPSKFIKNLDLATFLIIQGTTIITLLFAHKFYNGWFCGTNMCSDWMQGPKSVSSYWLVYYLCIHKCVHT